MIDWLTTFATSKTDGLVCRMTIEGLQLCCPRQDQPICSLPCTCMFPADQVILLRMYTQITMCKLGMSYLYLESLELFLNLVIQRSCLCIIVFEEVKPFNAVELRLALVDRHHTVFLF
jgi:hypothetical protein